MGRGSGLGAGFDAREGTAAEDGEADARILRVHCEDVEGEARAPGHLRKPRRKRVSSRRGAAEEEQSRGAEQSSRAEQQAESCLGSVLGWSVSWLGVGVGLGFASPTPNQKEPTSHARKGWSAL